MPVLIFLFFFLFYNDRDANTIFRGNTLVSKMMDEVMQLAGSHYLRSTLKPSLEQILTEKKCCEIDPSRIKDVSQVENNLTNLKVLKILFLRIGEEIIKKKYLL